MLYLRRADYKPDLSCDLNYLEFNNRLITEADSALVAEAFGANVVCVLPFINPDFKANPTDFLAHEIGRAHV